MSNEGTGTQVVGLSIPDSQDAAELLKAAREDGFDYVATTLPSSLEDARSDVTALDSRWWRTCVVGSIGNDLSQATTQMEWANHMNIPAVILPEVPTPLSDATFEYARTTASLALQASATGGNVWIKTRLNQNSLSAFDTLHRHCDGASNVGMLLCLDEESVNSEQTKERIAALLILLHKAIGSQLKAISIPAKVFLTNKRGFPALSKTHQVLLTEVLRRIGRTVRLLLEGPGVLQVPPGDANMAANLGKTQCLLYLQYLRHVRQRPEVTDKLDSEEAGMEEPYLDHLQRPLQPLADHLEFQTYETFEKDPVKYDRYQTAIQQALHDGLNQMKPSETTKTVVIMVVGAGRGPLVTAALEAIAILPSIPFFVQFQIFAVEKNPSAIVYLQSQAQHNNEWKGRVTVVHSDMRQLTSQSLGGHQADVVVSELLGSFGDNELSPECLDGFYRTGLWKDSTVCIPQKYTAFLAPISSARLHSEARAQAYFPEKATDGMDSAPMGPLRALETPYVVRTHAACQTHHEQSCWEFVHPTTMESSKGHVAHLEFAPDPRYGAGCGSGYGPIDTVLMELVQDSVQPTGPVTIHGFVGTFTAILYQPQGSQAPVSISTRPADFSTGMFSWFPLYFPLREPLYVPGGATLLCSIWRRTETNATGTSGRVWYEWLATATSPSRETLAATAMHNPNGRSYEVKL